MNKNLKTNYVIYKDGECSYVLGAIKKAFDTKAEILADTAPSQSGEIVIGSTSRDITARATAALSDLLTEKTPELIAAGIPEEDITGFIVFSDGESVALVWKDFQTVDKAVAYLEENLPALPCEAGVLYSEFFSIMAYLTERAKRLKAAKWTELEAHIPEEYREDVVRELKLLDSLRMEKAAKWIASLYDPETGAWYISESGRDHEGFGPDIESTFYALSLVGYTGMAEMFDGKDYMEKFTKAYPEDILEKVGNWLYNLQDEDGYFYVPQWPKKYIEENGKQIRITRDVGTAKRVLRALGITPKYSDAQKSGGKNKESKSALLTQYESVENFREYLAGFDKELETCTEAERGWKFYLWGSYFQSTVGMMNDEMKRMMVDFFNKHQRPDNGVWTEELSYNSTNAIHKICSVYNSIGAPMNYIDEMIDSTLEILGWKVEDKPCGSSCEIYNVWSVFPYLYENIRNCGAGTSEEREARCKDKKALVFKGAAEAINTSYHQIKELCLPDGSFSAFRGHSYSSVYGCPCALGIKEGDIGGFLLGAWDVEEYALRALELDSYAPLMFTEKDRLVYMRALREVKPPVKKPKPQA